MIYIIYMFRSFFAKGPVAPSYATATYLLTAGVSVFDVSLTLCFVT